MSNIHYIGKSIGIPD